MTTPWRLATIGVSAVVTTALLTGLATAYFMRPAPATMEPVTTQSAALATQPAPMIRRAVPATYHPAPTPPPAPVRRTERIAAPVAAASSADCATGTGRALRIAKPGAIGALIGAGVGAAGGAVADGGHGAGKGAIIGGLAGAVLGSGYGAYTTKNECGTILGNAVSSPTLVTTAR